LQKSFSISVTCALVLSLLMSAHLISAQKGQTRPRPQLIKREPARQESNLLQTPIASNTEAEVSDDDVVRVETNLVSTLFTAVDSQHRFLTNLQQQDIRVLENGVPQAISVFQRESDLPLSLAVLIDVSKSQERTLPDEQKAANEFLGSVLRPDKDQATAISFNGKALMEQALTNKTDRLKEAINRLKVEIPQDNPDCDPDDKSVEDDPRCWSGIWDAVWASTNEVLSQTPERTRRAIILMTDGDDTSSITKVNEAIDFAVRNNVLVYGIGIGDRKEFKVDEESLRKLAERTGGRAFFPLNEADLRGAFALIEQELRSQYLIAYSPQNKARDGSFRKIKIEVLSPELRKKNIKLLYRQGYYAKRG
jgi:VWFA-related protein